MIIREYEVSTVWSHKDLEITPEFLEEMNKCFHDDCEVSENYKITEDVIAEWAIKGEDALDMPVMHFDDGTSAILGEWINDYMIDYFTDDITESFVDDRTYQDSMYKIWKE